VARRLGLRALQRRRDLDVLRKAVADGALAGGFHPLHMFGEAGDAGALAGCAIALAGSDALVRRLARLARALEAKPLRLPEGGRALVSRRGQFLRRLRHCAHEGTIALWGKLGIAEADALAALLPLLRGTAHNVEKLGAAGAWERDRARRRPAPSAGTSTSSQGKARIARALPHPEPAHHSPRRSPRAR